MAQPDAWSPERYRQVLRLMARRLALDPRLQRRFDASDLVQETLLKAHHCREQFRGQSKGERLKWLHEILVNTARDKIREARADKRNVELEESLDGLAADSSARLARWAAGQSSPGDQAERHELLLKVGEALDQLPAEQRPCASPEQEAENDDIDLKAKNLNSRFLFSPKESGVYHLIATSYQQRGVGPYTLVIGEFAGNKK